MATLAIKKRYKKPAYDIQFQSSGKRVTIHLGGRSYSPRMARELRDVVEALLFYQSNAIPIPDKRILAWLESAPQPIQQKLAKAGLIEIPQSRTLKELWKEAISQKSVEVKQSTVVIYETAKTHFFSFFGEEESVLEVTLSRMMEWKSFLCRTLATATVAGTISKAKAVFNWAVKAGWIEKSPMDGVKCGSFVNKANDRIITLDEYRALLDACPCKDWRVIIALSRIGGLRCPSEVFNLRWSDVNWEKGRFYVTSPKTERHLGKEGRLVPLFPELKEELESLFFDSESEGREFVINRYRNPSLGAPFEKIARIAGLPKIPRPFDNMRMSRSNEVYDRFGPFKESQWIGHSGKVRDDHYLMIQEGDWHEASDWTVSKEQSVKRSVSTGIVDGFCGLNCDP